MRRIYYPIFAVAAFCFALSGYLVGTTRTVSIAPTPLPPTGTPFSTPTSAPTLTPRPQRFATVTPIPISVPTLRGPTDARVVSSRFDYAADVHPYPYDDEAEVRRYLTQPTAVSPSPSQVQSHLPLILCGDESFRIAGKSTFISQDIGWMLCAGFSMKNQQAKRLYRSEDGGKQWTLINTSQFGGDDGTLPNTLPDGGSIASLYFLDASHGWMGLNSNSEVVEINWHASSLLSTDDGGVSWKPVPITNGQSSITDIAFTTPREGIVAVQDPIIHQRIVLATHDGGVTWEQPYPKASPNLLWQFVDTQHGFGAGTLLDPAAILATDDGGVAWHGVSTLRDATAKTSVIALSFPDALNGWTILSYDSSASRYTQLFHTTDGGKTWMSQSKGNGQIGNISAVTFKDARNGIVASYGNGIWITDDGGMSFRPFDSAVPQPPWQIAGQTAAGKPALTFELYLYNPYPPPYATPGWTRIPIREDIDGFQIEDGVHTRDVVAGCDRRKFSGIERCQAMLFVSVNGGPWTRYDLGDALPARVQFEGERLRWLGRAAGPLYRTDDGGESWVQVR